MIDPKLIIKYFPKYTATKSDALVSACWRYVIYGKRKVVATDLSSLIVAKFDNPTPFFMNKNGNLARILNLKEYEMYDSETTLIEDELIPKVENVLTQYSLKREWTVTLDKEGLQNLRHGIKYLKTIAEKINGNPIGELAQLGDSAVISARSLNNLRTYVQFSRIDTPSPSSKSGNFNLKVLYNSLEILTKIEVDQIKLSLTTDKYPACMLSGGEIDIILNSIRKE